MTGTGVLSHAWTTVLIEGSGGACYARCARCGVPWIAGAPYSACSVERKSSTRGPMTRIIAKRCEMTTQDAQRIAELLESTANMLGGMQLDPAIPQHAKDAMKIRITALEEAVFQLTAAYDL